MILDTMKERGSMSELLRGCLREAKSIRAVARATGLDHASLVRFLHGQRSLRLDKAEALAAYFGIECRRTRKAEGSK